MEELVKDRPKENRSSLARLEGKLVKCTGRFVQARVSDEQFITLLFREVWVDTVYYDHLWVIHNDAFEGKDLQHNCMVEFHGTVKKYNEESARYGVAYCRDVSVLGYDQKTQGEEFSAMQLAFRTVNYEHRMPDTSQKAYLQFRDDYGFGTRDKIRLVYSPVLTMNSGEREVSFEAYDENGRMAEFSSITFNPVRDDHKVMIDRKYYVKINETMYRQLCLLYYLVTRTRKGCMAYVPQELLGEYSIVLSGDKEVYYHQGKKMFTLMDGESACIGRPACREKGAMQKCQNGKIQ